MRIALIHAVTVAMAPVHDAFSRLWPDAERIDILDTSLPGDLARDGRLTPAMMQRFATLTRYAEDISAAGILFTCSAFGAAIDAAAAAAGIPALKPNEAMFEAALNAGTRLGMLATFAPAAASMEAEFRDLAGAGGSAARLETVCVPEAMQALQAGEGATHDVLLAEAAPRLSGCDAVMLAHFSTSRALAAVQPRLPCPVLTAPDAAVRKLKALLC
ncbi:MAG TPA: arylsulfatase [Stellaceae bacterium]|nr:arylsulfatase [Stellaceae bacterium]